MEGIWRQVIDVFRGGILADWYVSLVYLRFFVSSLCDTSSAAETLSLDIQEKEENFDLALIAALEIDVVPHLGTRRVPNSVLTQLAKVLAQGSQLYDSTNTPYSPQDDSGRGLTDYIQADDRHYGSTDSGLSLPRERFSYWCFDLLFLICSDTTKGS